MKLQSISLIILTFAICINCEKPSAGKRKIKLAANQQSPNDRDIPAKSTVLKFDAQDRQSLAVLSFENQSEDKNLEWLCKGITDMLIRDFSQSRSLKVTTLQRIFDIFKQ